MNLMVKLKSSTDFPAISAGLLGIILLSTGLVLAVTSGEQSKMVYGGNLWCVSNFIEQEPQELLKDGRPRRDRRLDGKEDWIRRQQVSANSAEEAMSKATVTGSFERSDKNRMRQALEQNDKVFFAHHFNAGATAAGPCEGGGAGQASVGMWINDAIRAECFGLSTTAPGPQTGPDQTASGTQQTEVTACGETISTLVDGYTIIPSLGKLGSEEHLTETKPTHYVGPDSKPVTFAGAGAFAPHQTDQERWYFNTQWGGWDWEPTRVKKAPRLSYEPGASTARNKIRHSKLVLTSVETGKSMVVSAEESGPALWVTDIHGVNTGAPPEVRNYLGTSNAYTKNPNDNKGLIKIGFAKDQSIPLGPCK
jgi:hypothetical protein